MKTVCITGAHGFLGRHTAKLFKAKGYRVIGVGHGEWGFDNPSGFGIDKWIESDVDFTTLSKIDDKIDLVVHCAGGSSVGYSVEYPFQDFSRTVISTANVLEYIRLHQPKAKLIYPSSAAVYGKKNNDKPIKINDRLDPLSPYGFHKKMAEDLCLSYSKNFDISVAIVRFFSIYGPGLQKQLLWDSCNKFFSKEGRVEFFGTGDETRDWIQVSDAASLIYFMAQSGKKYTIVNGGYGKAVTIKEITLSLAAFFGNNIEIDFNRQSREGDPKHYWADISCAKEFGWQPLINIGDGLAEYANWYKKQQ